MYKLPDDQYEKLRERVRDGKKHLEGKWGRYRTLCKITEKDEKFCVDLWFTLCRELVDQDNMRAEHRQKVLPKSRLPGETPDEYVERKRAEAIQKGLLRGRWAKPWLRAYLRKKGGEAPQNVQKESAGNSLFEPSLL